jgi:mannose-1-phosphate guanylyltransferase
MSKNYVVIMAGGIGSRFWPASRKARPKQFLDILGTGKSLIRLTFERFLEIVPASNILVVTHKDYQEDVKKELPELEYNQILAEPARKNTAPCVAYAAYKIAAKTPDANFVVAPSDHLILKEQAFLDQIQKALDFAAQKEVLLTLGIQPSHPNTGYGYINFDQQQEERRGCRKSKLISEPPQ